MLTTFEPDVFTALRHHTGCSCTTTDDRSDRSAFATTGDSADDRADTGSSTNFRRIVFGGVASFDTTFGIDLSCLSPPIGVISRSSA